ncbi:hypothetical protein MT349_09210 [Rathayibacter caricis]|uniref:hypothetical protein n=1 Tax=Rathayibacter caricis TaxID=110936 RepID=UPI001FB3A573|nr:hypothetical protein [Rathayibacter caricis]MCJ1695963.1 hypothetical protein [Rathayibacter caricis]
MRDADTAVVWDVHAEDFRVGGHLHRLLEECVTQPFGGLVEEEGARREAFLREWERQIFTRAERDTTWRPDLRALFEEAPRLSGVLYVSQNHVLSEALFEKEPERKAHFTDRPLHPAARSALPRAHDLTFSFPRLYTIEGFSHAWGFMRIERFNDEENGAAVLLSTTTIDSEIMELLRSHGRSGLLSKYNQSWNDGIHDYLHHIALYTNPSFGIGKISPMSLHGLHEEVDAWGEDMHSTFNYEYWAHRTHRAITTSLIDEEKRADVRIRAEAYFAEVRAFGDELASHHPSDYAQRVVDYLACIYLWPLRVLFSPLDPLFDRLAPWLDALHLDPAAAPEVTAEKLVEQMFAEAELADPPRAADLRAVATALRPDARKGSSAWSTTLRLKTTWCTQRGYYEGWFHEIPIMYRGRPAMLHDPAEAIIRRVVETRNSYEPIHRAGDAYVLRGISTLAPATSSS